MQIPVIKHGNEQFPASAFCFSRSIAFRNDDIRFKPLLLLFSYVCLLLAWCGFPRAQRETQLEFEADAEEIEGRSSWPTSASAKWFSRCVIATLNVFIDRDVEKRLRELFISKISREVLALETITLRKCLSTKSADEDERFGRRRKQATVSVPVSCVLKFVTRRLKILTRIKETFLSCSLVSSTLWAFELLIAWKKGDNQKQLFHQRMSHYHASDGLFFETSR